MWRTYQHVAELLALLGAGRLGDELALVVLVALLVDVLRVHRPPGLAGLVDEAALAVARVHQLSGMVGG